jgi:hypothetical protein
MFTAFRADHTFINHKTYFGLSEPPLAHPYIRGMYMDSEFSILDIASEFPME